MPALREDLREAAELQQAQMSIRLPQRPMLSLQAGVPNQLSLWQNQTQCSLWKGEECTYCVSRALSVSSHLIYLVLSLNINIINRNPSRITPKCHHAIKHRCHKSECPPCGQVCGLPNDSSKCGHICKARCHEAVRVNKPAEGRPQAKKVRYTLKPPN